MSTPSPPFPSQTQPLPGSESRMDPQPDYGEKSYIGSGLLQNKVALITGGDSGIGRAVAFAFASEGADISISYLSEDKDALQIQEIIRNLGRKCEIFPGDIGLEKHCQELVSKTISNHRHLDILINNAAYQFTVDSISQVSSSELEQTFRTNIYSMFYLVKAALPHLTSGSSIINTASTQAYDPSPNLIAYAATKAAIVNFTRSLAKELISKFIRVNAVAPGPVWTPLIPATMEEDNTKNFGADTLFKRPAQPVEIAPIFVFLASDKASYVTGHTYPVTGHAFP